MYARSLWRSMNQIRQRIVANTITTSIETHE